jgi:hypothetical protein
MMMTAYTFDSNLVSDLHKDAFGFRPSDGFWAEWRDGSDEQRQALWDRLIERLDSALEQEEIMYRENVREFELMVSKSIAAGAADRETALRWIMQASDCGGDWERLEYQQGVPFGYITREFMDEK